MDMIVITDGDALTSALILEEPNAASRLDAMGAEERDALPFGLIGLDACGRVTVYNQCEAMMTGRPASSVVGRCFFGDVAPCSEDEGFRTLFREGLDHGELDVVIDWSLDVGQSTHRVAMRMVRSRLHQGVWIIVKRL